MIIYITGYNQFVQNKKLSGQNQTQSINSMEKLLKKSTRISTSKSTSRSKMAKEKFIQINYTDTGPQTNKIKIHSKSKQLLTQRNSIDITKIPLSKIKSTSLKKSNTKLKSPIQYINSITQNRIKNQNFFYEGVDTQKLHEHKFIKKQSLSKRSEAKSLQKKRVVWNQKNIPYDWSVVLSDFGHLLTKYEKSQIKQYKKIYYIGQNAKKKQPIDDSQPLFDNQEQLISLNRKQYVYILHDHIGYRYEILGVLGKGSYGQVLKVFDHKKGQQMALKIIRNKQKFNKQAFVQIEILTYVKQHDSDHTSNIIKIKDFIIFRKHVCIVFEMLSQNLYQLIIRNNYSGLNMQLIRRFSIQILGALDFLRKNNIIHCDLKPQNILLREYDKSGIKIIDLGSSCFRDQTVYTYIQSRYYRAPQITLGIKYDTSIDMWSAGCILAQLYTGVPLFPGQNQRQQMKYMIDTLGPPPKEMLKKGNRVQVFFQGYKLKQQIANTKHIPHFSKTLEERIQDPLFRSFVLLFLNWNPIQRASPVQAMNHIWIKDGLPPQLRNMLPSDKSQQFLKSKTSAITGSKSKSFQKSTNLRISQTKGSHGRLSRKIVNLLKG